VCTTVLVIWLVGLYLPLFFGGFPTPIDSLDFSYYFAAARIGLEHGWGHIYDLGLQRSQFYQLHPATDVFDWRRYFVSPPPVAWLVAPFTALPVAAAFWTFTSLAAAAFVLWGWVATPGRGLGRLALFLAAACVYPVLIAVQTGQVVPLVATATLVAWWLLRRGAQVGAGLVLVLVVLKPQVAILVAPALLLAGQRRLFAAWLAGAAVLVAASLWSLSGNGLEQLRAALGAEQGQAANLAWTLAGLVGPGPRAAIAEVACGLVALLVAWKVRGRGIEAVMVPGLLGTLLASPYHNPSDFAILAPAVWLHVRSGMPAWHWAWLGFGLLATYLAAGWGPDLLLVFTLGWLVLFLVPALADRPAARAERAPVAP
jgi:hypothetical protein